MPLTSYNLTDIVNYINQLELRMQQYEVGQQEMLVGLQELENISTNSSIALIRADHALSEINTATLESFELKGKRLHDVISRIKQAIENAGIEIPLPVKPEVKPDEPETEEEYHIGRALFHEYLIPYSHNGSIEQHRMINDKGAGVHFFTTLQVLDALEPLESTKTILRERDASWYLQVTDYDYLSKLKEAFWDNSVRVEGEFSIGLASAVSLCLEDPDKYSDFVQGVVENPMLRITTVAKVTKDHDIYEKHFKNYPMRVKKGAEESSILPSTVYWIDIEEPNSKVIIK